MLQSMELLSGTRQSTYKSINSTKFLTKLPFLRCFNFSQSKISKVEPINNSRPTSVGLIAKTWKSESSVASLRGPKSMTLLGNHGPSLKTLPYI